MIKTSNDFLTDDELRYLQSKCESFVKNNETIPDGKFWFYNSMHLWNDSKLDNLCGRLSDVVGDRYEIQYNGIFINKITTETNKNDDYHIDSCDLTAIIYLNNDFIGGNLECQIKGGNIQIVPEKNLLLLMERGINHRVLPITNGERYSLIVWFRKKKKDMF
jgi:hypothetical protein